MSFSKAMKFNKFIYALVAVAMMALSAGVQAAGGGGLNDSVGNDVADTASLQRGVGNYVNYCMGCHSMQYVRYNSVGEDLGLTDEQLINNLMFSAERTTDLMDNCHAP